MARNDNNKRPRKAVNRVPKRAQNEELKLGNRKRAEEDDIIKRPKKHAVDMNTTKAQAPTIEQGYIRKGRKIAQEKEKVYKDRHAPRKSEIEKEYTKELQKLRNRLKYREKQGFFVQWESLPSRKLSPTEKDIEQLKQYQVQINDEGEIYLKRDYINLAQLDALSMPTGLLPKNLLQNEQGFETPPDTEGEFDVIERIRGDLWDAYYRITTGVEREDFNINIDLYTDLEQSKEQAIRQAIDIFESNISRYPIALVSKYFEQHQAQIKQLLEAIQRESRTTVVQELQEQLIRYLEFH